jgi:hypothetical protein
MYNDTWRPLQFVTSLKIVNSGHRVRYRSRKYIALRLRLRLTKLLRRLRFLHLKMCGCWLTWGRDSCGMTGACWRIPRQATAGWSAGRTASPRPCIIIKFLLRVAGGEFLRPPENRVPQTIVFRYKEIGDKLCGKQRKKVMLLCKYSLDRNNTIASLFRTQYIPHFLIAEYYGLRNNIFWGLRISPWDNFGLTITISSPPPSGQRCKMKL